LQIIIDLLFKSKKYAQKEQKKKQATVSNEETARIRAASRAELAG
jgi:hypothetical protein